MEMAIVIQWVRLFDKTGKTHDRKGTERKVQEQQNGTMKRKWKKQTTIAGEQIIIMHECFFQQRINSHEKYPIHFFAIIK